MSPDKVLPAETDRPNSSFRTPDALVGRVLYERFLIERDLSDRASGGNCSSYLAKDLRHFCRKVVVRALTQPPTEREGPSNAFQDVCDTLMRLDHPNIEWILETGRLFDGRPYAVTTYTAGQTLSQILRGDRRLVLDRVAHIVESVAEALGAAHSEEILHWDVAPANIVITLREREAESVRLTGFGSAWPADSAPSRFANIHLGCESLLYTAPELLAEDGRETPASDIYSLAAVAYRMLTGEVPFKATDREDLIESVKLGLQVWPSDLRTDLRADAEAILLSGLQFRAVMRPRDARLFGHDLADALRDGAYHFKTSRQIKAGVAVKSDTLAISEAPVSSADEMPSGESKKRSAQKPAAVVSDRAIAWSLIILLLAGALSIPIGKTIRDDEQRAAAVSSMAKKPADTRLPREIRYSFDGQNIKNLTATGFQPTLQNSLVKSGEYKLTFESDSAGNAYLFSEADEQGRTVYNVLYPLPKVNDGSAHIEPRQQAKSRTGSFSETRNSEIVWLVWTAGKQDDLESARRSALEADGIVRNENDVQKLKHFLERNKNNKLDVRKEDADLQTVLNGSGDKIVHRIELEHN